MAGLGRESELGLTFGSTGIPPLPLGDILAALRARVQMPLPALCARRRAWVTRLNLEQAVETGEAIELEPGAEFATTLRAEIQESTR